MRTLRKYGICLMFLAFLIPVLSGCGSNKETEITFDGSKITISGNGAGVSGNVVTITAAGNYRLSGTLDDGQIIVDTEDGKAVYLHLDNMGITCSTDSPIIVKNCILCVLWSEDGTQNIITDNHPYTELPGGSESAENIFSDDPDAAVYSKCPLLVKATGSGKLVVHANAHNGISTSDTLTVESGNLSVDAAYNALRGKDYVVISDGNINLKAGNDAIKATNTEDASLGYINITGGTLTVHADDDGICATNSISISKANVTLKSKNIAFKTEGALSFTSGVIDITTEDEVFVCGTKKFESAAVITVNGEKYTE